MVETEMPNIGYHAVYEQDYPSAIMAAAKYGFQYVQFDLNVPTFYIDRLSKKELNSIRNIAADLGIRISFHAPGDNVSLFTDYPNIRKGILDHLKLVLQQANRLNAHHLTVHPLDPPSFRRADQLKDTFQLEQNNYFKHVLKENVTELVDNAGNVLVLVENCQLGMTASEALSELFVEGTAVFLTLDWAKMHNRTLLLNEAQSSFYTQHKSKIREIHLHDMDTSGRSHLLPGQGSLDFGQLFSQFYDQSQWLTIEVRPVLEAFKARPIFIDLIEKSRGI